jgi:hypothetical protein
LKEEKSVGGAATVLVIEHTYQLLLMLTAIITPLKRDTSVRFGLQQGEYAKSFLLFGGEVTKNSFNMFF